MTKTNKKTWDVCGEVTINIGALIDADTRIEAYKKVYETLSLYLPQGDTPQKTPAGSMVNPVYFDAWEICPNTTIDTCWEDDRGRERRITSIVDDLKDEGLINPCGDPVDLLQEKGAV